MDLSALTALSHELRISIIEMLEEAKSGHPGGSLSAIDLLTALWFSEMRGVESATNLAPDRDRFVLSKGHGVPALYAILARKGFIREEELKTLRRTGSRLQGHPDRMRLPIVEASTGSLGQGLSVAQGLALALRMDAKPGARVPRVYCMVGDGEIQEGQIWEAAMSAPKFKLSNLCVMLDGNNGQIDGKVSDIMPLEPLKDKWAAFGWNVLELDGHDMAQIQRGYREAREIAENGGTQPTFIIARTTKGKGVSFMEHKVEWHGVAPKKNEALQAIDEIRKLVKGGV